MRIKLLALTIFLFLCSLFADEEYSKLPVARKGIDKYDIMKLEYINPGVFYFKGEVLPSQTASLSFDIPGRIASLKSLGDYVFAAIYSDKGEIIQKGTVVAAYDTRRQKFKLESAKMAKKIAMTQLELFEKEFKRMLTLLKKKVISEKIFLETQTAYYNAKINLDIADNMLEEAVFNYRSCFLYSPFTGIVSNVYKTIGDWISSGIGLIEVMKINPVLVKVKIPPLVSEVTVNDVDVVVSSTVNNESVTGKGNCKELDKENLYVYLNNMFEEYDLDKAEKYTKVREIFNVQYLYDLKVFSMGHEPQHKDNQQSLMVPEKAIRHDDDGDFVLMMKEEMYGDNIFVVQKAYVSLSDIIINKIAEKGVSIKYHALKDSGILKVNDAVICDKNLELKESDRVVKGSFQWKFFPGDTVKVRIPSYANSGYYVPEDAIIYQGRNDIYVYIVESTGKASLKKVSITGCFGNYYAIAGIGIEKGGKVIVFKNDEQIRSMYDGKRIMINSRLKPPTLEMTSKKVYYLKNGGADAVNKGAKLYSK